MYIDTYAYIYLYIYIYINMYIYVYRMVSGRKTRVLTQPASLQAHKDEASTHPASVVPINH